MKYDVNDTANNRPHFVGVSNIRIGLFALKIVEMAKE